MDLVYICKDGENEELRYSIRSAVANMPHNKVWVVGGKPEWYSGNHINVPQTASKMDNAKNNLLAIISSPKVSESFILMNDDFFIMKPIKEVPTYHGGFLKENILKRSKENKYGAYLSLLNQTHLYLAKLLKTMNIIDYDIHVPMVMEKSKLKEVLKHSSLWRSTYGNMYSIGGEKIDDVKIHKYDPKIKFDFNIVPYISTEDESFNDLYNVLFKDMFPYPSIYENPYAESNCG